MSKKITPAPFKYETGAVPDGYSCHKCKRKSKLWRQYQTFACYIELLCVDCAGKDQKKDVSKADADGLIHGGEYGPSDSIGWLVPAVPVEEGGTYWGYTSVPDAGVTWWKNLPTRVEG